MKHNYAYCIGNYDFDKIALYAHKRFIEGLNLMDLISQTESHKERQEIALVASFSTTDSIVEDLKLDCPYKEQCKVTNCRIRIKEKIENCLH